MEPSQPLKLIKASARHSSILDLDPPCEGGHTQGPWASLLPPGLGLPLLLGSLGKPCLASSRRVAFNFSF